MSGISSVPTTASPKDWHPLTIEKAYSYCQQVAKREAKNFYYAFRILPRHKRDAMCAIYAFMRRADDIADDESLTISERRIIMSQWLAAWRASSRADKDPVFIAVRDTQQRFGITDELLEQLIRGTSLDLEDYAPGVVQVPAVRISDTAIIAQQPLYIYDRFDDLYRYCYLVASVVGLVCIRIFGYTDPRAEILAEYVGIAFQLTNILRDVKEDAERHRIYLPREDLTSKRLEVRHLLLTIAGALPPATMTPTLAMEAERAKEYYRAADELIPMLDRDSRAAMWVLVTIYRGLLERIVASNYDVFSKRISVPSSHKMSILAQGAGKAFWSRVFA